MQWARGVYTREFIATHIWRMSTQSTQCVLTVMLNSFYKSWYSTTSAWKGAKRGWNDQVHNTTCLTCLPDTELDSFLHSWNLESICMMYLYILYILYRRGYLTGSTKPHTPTSDRCAWTKRAKRFWQTQSTSTERESKKVQIRRICQIRQHDCTTGQIINPYITVLESEYQGS